MDLLWQPRNVFCNLSCWGSGTMYFRVDIYPKAHLVSYHIFLMSWQRWYLTKWNMKRGEVQIKCSARNFGMRYNVQTLPTPSYRSLHIPGITFRYPGFHFSALGSVIRIHMFLFIAITYILHPCLMHRAWAIITTTMDVFSRGKIRTILDRSNSSTTS